MKKIKKKNDAQELIVDELSMLKDKLRNERREDIVQKLLQHDVGTLMALEQHWREEKSRRAHQRLWSEKDEQDYQEAKEMHELIGYVLANYQELKPVQETSNPTSGKAVLSVSDTAKYLGVSESIVRGKIKRNEIPYVRIDGQYKFYLPVLEEWLKQKSVQPKSDNDTKTQSAQIAKGILNDTME